MRKKWTEIMSKLPYVCDTAIATRRERGHLHCVRVFRWQRFRILPGMAWLLAARFQQNPTNVAMGARADRNGTAMQKKY